MESPRCSVLHCERAAVHAVALAPGSPDAGVCAAHHGALADVPWVHDRTRGGIRLGAELHGLLRVDRATMQVNASYSPGVGTFSTLSIDGRSLGSGEPASVEVVLTDDVVRQLAKLVWMFQRTR